jgi:hypothetical protein
MNFETLARALERVLFSFLTVMIARFDDPGIRLSGERVR